MAQYSWFNCPENVHNQINGLLKDVKCCLKDNMVGIYLHGSLAMGCFNPEISDIDILVIIEQNLDVETKRELIELLLCYSNQPKPIEISFLIKRYLARWEYPTPFDLHYSEDWRQYYIEQLNNGEWRQWNQPEYQHKDLDLAAHLMVTKHRGVCLLGKSIIEVFPEIPVKDYIDSIMYDFTDCVENITDNTVYCVLNMCRAYCYLTESKICSKEEGGVWALSVLPQQYHDIVKQALDVYRGNVINEGFDLVRVKEFVDYVDKKVNALLDDILEVQKKTCKKGENINV